MNTPTIKPLLLPWPDRALHPNARVHFMALAKAKKAARQSAAWAASMLKFMHRKTIAVGCESPLARGVSRNTARDAAFSIQATSFGGSDGMAQAMPATLRVPRSLTPIRAAAPCESGLAAVHQARLAGGSMTEPQKTCKKCGTSYPLSGFNKLSRSTDGHHGWCRGCSKSAAMEWKSKNRELCRELYARWVAANPEKIKAKNKSHYEKNKEAECKAAAAWRAANPERVREYGAEWREGNRDIARKNSAQWRAENPDAVKAHHQNRRAMKKMAGGKLSAGLAKQLLKLQKGKCACCGMPLGVGFHMDHVMPLALGGSNTDDNMQLLRATCNLQKHDKHPVDFMQQRGFLL